MRATLFSTLALVSYASGALLYVRQAAPPNCTVPCLNTGTNNISTGSCGASDLACLCASQPYVQAVINCLATECSSHADVLQGIQYSTAYCGAAGVNQGPSVTTPTAQLTATGGASQTGGASGSSSASSPASTTSHSGAERVNMLTSSVLVGALVLVAAGMGL